MDQASDRLRFPIGKFILQEEYTPQEYRQNVDIIESLPVRLEEAVSKLSNAALDRPYRPGGWSKRQVIHHLADSHMNSLCRFKLALTEDKPQILPYNQDEWANLPDTALSVDVSIRMLDGIHQRWVALLNGMSSNDLQKTFYHPDMDYHWSLDKAAALYAWHCDHHLAHVNL